MEMSSPILLIIPGHVTKLDGIIVFSPPDLRVESNVIWRCCFATTYDNKNLSATAWLNANNFIGIKVVFIMTDT